MSITGLPLDTYIFTASYMVAGDATAVVSCLLRDAANVTIATMNRASSGTAFSDSSAITAVANATGANVFCSATGGNISVGQATLVAVQMGTPIP